MQLDNLDLQIAPLVNKRKAKTITDEEKTTLNELLAQKRQARKQKKEEKKESKEEKKERKRRKRLYEQIVADFYNIKARKRELKEELAEKRSELAELRSDFPTLIGILESNIEGKSDKRKRDEEIEGISKRVKELESKEKPNQSEKGELKNKRRKLKTIEKEETKLDLFSAAMVIDSEKRKEMKGKSRE